MVIVLNKMDVTVTPHHTIRTATLELRAEATPSSADEAKEATTSTYGNFNVDT